MGREGGKDEMDTQLNTNNRGWGRRERERRRGGCVGWGRGERERRRGGCVGWGRGEMEGRRGGCVVPVEERRRGGEEVVWSPVEERGWEGEESEGAREGMVKLSHSHRSWTLSMQLKYTEGGQVVRVSSQQGHLIFLSVDEGRVGLSLVGQNGTREEVTHTQQLPRNVFTSVVSVCVVMVCVMSVCG